MENIVDKAKNFLGDLIEWILFAHPGELTISDGDLGRNLTQYRNQLVPRTVAVLLAFDLILSLMPGFATTQDLSIHEAYTVLVTGQFRGDDVASNGKLTVSKSLVHTMRAGAIVPLDGPVLVGEPVTYKLSGNPDYPYWELGDGSTAEGASVTHTYQKPGVYRVVMGSKVGDTLNEESFAIVRVHTPETLHLPQVLLDTDAANEIDDQQYIAYGLFSNLDVLANSIHHTQWADNETRLLRAGTETRNFYEILTILDLAKKSGLPDARVPRVFRGSKEPLKNMGISRDRWFDTKPIVTEASEAILAAASGASPDNPVWVLPVGPATNITCAKGIRVEQVVEGEDVASGPKGEESNRWGVAGIFYVFKIAGAKAPELATLDEVKRVADKAAANVRTMGVALSPCIVQEVGKLSFTLGEDQMEITMGIHGEPGIRRGKLKPADPIVEEMQLLLKAGMKIAQAAPSTMGTLVGRGFMKGGKAILNTESLSLSDLSVFFRAFTDGIMEAGKTKPGNKTIVDALDPASKALEEASVEGKNLAEGIQMTHKAAREGVENTKCMKA